MTPRTAAPVLVMLLLLTGCGGTDMPVAKDPAPTTAQPTTESSATPEWMDCAVHSQSFIDYVAGAKGAATVEEAVRDHAPDGTTIMKVPDEPHRSDRWDIVDADNQIIREVSVFDGENGWLVDSVEECSG